MRTRLRSRPSLLLFTFLPVVACGGPLEEEPAADDHLVEVPMAPSSLTDMLPEPDSDDTTLTALARNSTGNGAPSGAHYTLNIIGKSHDLTADMTGNNGHRIFVDLNGNTRIQLREGPDFQVVDANGTDGRASFELPNPDPENDGVTAYSVYARALGTPGGSSTTTTCAIDPLSGEEYCSTESMVLVRSRGGSKFQNVSRELLYMYVDLDGDGVTERYPLFSDELEDYAWSYDNNGLRLAQLRFYPQPSDVN